MTPLQLNKRLTLATFNVPKTDNDSYELEVGAIIGGITSAGLNVHTIKDYVQNGHTVTFIQAECPFADDEGKLK